MKILLICLSGMGNAIMFTPTLENIYTEYPNSEITLITRWPATKQLFEKDPRINKILLLNNNLLKGIFNNIKVLFNIYKEKYDLAITTFPSNRAEYNIISFLSGAKKRVTHSYNVGKIRSLSFLQNYKIKIDESKHDVEQNFSLLRLLDIKPKKTKLKIYLTEEDKEFADNFLKHNKIKNINLLIGIHPSFNPEEKYKQDTKSREELFINLIKELNKFPKTKIILFGGPKEKEKINQMAELINPNPILATDNTLRQSAALISKCNLLINIDSGLGHIAAALSTPTITIYGPALPTRTRPYHEKGRVITKNLECQPCYSYPFRSCKQKVACKELRCFEEITVDDIIKEVKKILK